MLDDSFYTCRINGSDARKPFEVGCVEGQNVREIMGHHRSDETRVVRRLAHHLTLHDKFLPLAKDCRTVTPKYEKPFQSPEFFRLVGYGKLQPVDNNGACRDDPKLD